jgi:hypothetical protein
MISKESITTVSAIGSKLILPTGPDRLAEAPVGISSAFAGLRAPLIVIGMHRSGTSMVVGMLHIMGVYMDPDMSPDALSEVVPGVRARTDGYGEAVAFRLANEGVMRRSGSDWQHIDSFLEMRDDARFTSGCIRQLTDATNGSLKLDFLDRYPGGTPNVWGWKDPRNSLTLPYWLKIFPQARLLHVRRDAVAVVNSLMRRSTEKAANEAQAPPSIGERLRNAAANPTIISGAIRRRLGLSKPSGPMTRDDWLRLADRYTGECLKHRDHSPGYLEISYEAILADPGSHATAISRFAEIDANAAQIRDAAAFVLVDRKKAQNDPLK